MLCSMKPQNNILQNNDKDPGITHKAFRTGKQLHYICTIPFLLLVLGILDIKFLIFHLSLICDVKYKILKRYVYLINSLMNKEDKNACQYFQFLIFVCTPFLQDWRTPDENPIPLVYKFQLNVPEYIFLVFCLFIYFCIIIIPIR